MRCRRRLREKQRAESCKQAQANLKILKESYGVTVDNDASDFFTVVEVGAPDRLGLLFDVTRTLAELQLDVHLAKVATYGVRVVDAFYVRDALGRKVEDPVQIAEIEQALRSSIGAPS